MLSSLRKNHPVLKNLATSDLYQSSSGFGLGRALKSSALLALPTASLRVASIWFAEATNSSTRAPEIVDVSISSGAVLSATALKMPPEMPAPLEI